MDQHHAHKFQYDEKERRKRQNPEELLHAIGLKPGDVFMDIGSNDGFFTLPAAKMVGESGKVYAVDIDSDATNRLKEKTNAAWLTNILVQTGEAETTLFCKGCADIIFYGTVLHDFTDPLQVLHNAKAMLKPNGKIVNIDWKKKQTEMGPPMEIRFSEEQVSELIEKAGLRVTEIKDLSPNFYLITAAV